jgi:hypothetical protein
MPGDTVEQVCQGAAGGPGLGLGRKASAGGNDQVVGTKEKYAGVRKEVERYDS